jgi:hypothetical protein
MNKIASNVIGNQSNFTAIIMVERLQCHVKEYAWGKIGSNSEVSLLYAAGHDNFRIDEKKPYAEVKWSLTFWIYLNILISSCGWAHIQTDRRVYTDQIKNCPLSLPNHQVYQQS